LGVLTQYDLKSGKRSKPKMIKSSSYYNILCQKDRQKSRIGQSNKNHKILDKHQILYISAIAQKNLGSLNRFD